jgi:hypothetical protein
MLLSKQTLTDYLLKDSLAQAASNHLFFHLFLVFFQKQFSADLGYVPQGLSVYLPEESCVCV